MQHNNPVKYVIGPDGEKMTLADLPPPGIRRWVPRRKARVVAAVEGGLISPEEAYRRYEISEEEYISWRDHLLRHGLRGLCVTRLNTVRRTSG